MPQVDLSVSVPDAHVREGVSACCLVDKGRFESKMTRRDGRRPTAESPIGAGVTYPSPGRSALPAPKGRSMPTRSIKGAVARLRDALRPSATTPRRAKFAMPIFGRRCGSLPTTRPAVAAFAEGQRIDVSILRDYLEDRQVGIDAALLAFSWTASRLTSSICPMPSWARHRVTPGPNSWGLNGARVARGSSPRFSALCLRCGAGLRRVAVGHRAFQCCRSRSADTLRRRKSWLSTGRSGTHTPRLVR